MSYKVNISPRIAFTLLGDSLSVYSDTNIGDLTRKARINLINEYDQFNEINISLDGFNSLENDGENKVIKGKVFLNFISEQVVKSIEIADSTLLLTLKSKYKRNQKITEEIIVGELRKTIASAWNEEFSFALASLSELERNHRPIQAPAQQVALAHSYVDQEPQSFQHQSNKGSNAVQEFTSDLLQSKWTKFLLGAVFVFALVQMFLTISGNAIEVSNKKMEGNVYRNIGKLESHDEVVDKVFEKMGIERNAEKNDLSCFVE